ncbi:uncharacterized protein LOC129601270 isoform X2 [Paramacrobiotus metropolitanus]|nr:uncharacterized protein LOC129601270 isoform X2 [Paramacrobiotus metropolitanus]XP_055356015.1 uncharacterized protein LOC129601270 isoform X2 [Paramacrobiotus metropolitanus]XP_055356016.1 uncharacterized protein LOC129601270 isoform X2 [Paramacrobiotus metropolitanus]XP_055356017.1 uncharacterized protein LOC129601270 isoform X2 [Paramacrobiotus metropolitanus]XP_055356018.1 uncharacterized protein LOC129601270 isoform X2 [Paramacrobiotus metropolitanus]
MQLQGYGRGPSSRSFPIAEWPPNTELIRAPEGDTLVVPCNNSRAASETPVSHTAIPPAYTYNGQLVSLGATTTAVFDTFNEPNYCCNCTKDSASLRFATRGKMLDVATGAFSILLPHFSYSNTGLYECLHSDGTQLVVTQRYWVTVTLARHEVFHRPMQNITVRYGDPAEMVCPVRFHLLPGFLKTRFLWRTGSYLLIARSIPEVADKAGPWWGFGGRFEFGRDDEGHCNATMKFNSVTYKDAGLYECWFRINGRLDEWIMQEAYLHVI